MRFHYQRER